LWLAFWSPDVIGAWFIMSSSRWRLDGATASGNLLNQRDH